MSNNIKNFIYNNVLNILLVAAITIIITTQFIFYNAPEWFEGGDRVCNVFYNLSLSYLVSYIFYLVAFLPEKRSKKMIHSYILKHVGIIISSKSNIINDMQQKTGINGQISENHIKELVSAINPHSEAPLVVNTYNDPQTGKLKLIYANWAQYLVYYIDISRNSAKKLYPYLALVDTDLVQIINDVLECSYFYTADQVLRHIDKVSNQDLSTFSNIIYEYVMLVEKLEIKANEIKKIYKIK
ncbi:hypothetical protein [Tepidibacter hydrothermalis]|uniref:Uncharacterized protein n=1 Tax=Tepidibacter hydrothermalis TaxID=3036126 RepID=A0ABY8E7X2_9FIRM|nr:hypothetical protein [Tepidibacter hydrothermalis]WFD08987.1 hypothetical protein P4S50_11375 [Tepidibacter hydrothermalis]